MLCSCGHTRAGNPRAPRASGRGDRARARRRRRGRAAGAPPRGAHRCGLRDADRPQPRDAGSWRSFSRARNLTCGARGQVPDRCAGDARDSTAGARSAPGTAELIGFVRPRELERWTHARVQARLQALRRQPASATLSPCPTQSPTQGLGRARIAAGLGSRVARRPARSHRLHRAVRGPAGRPPRQPDVAAGVGRGAGARRARASPAWRRSSSRSSPGRCTEAGSGRSRTRRPSWSATAGGSSRAWSLTFAALALLALGTASGWWPQDTAAGGERGRGPGDERRARGAERSPMRARAISASPSKAARSSSRCRTSQRSAPSTAARWRPSPSSRSTR